MANAHARNEVRGRFEATLQQGKALLIAGAGNGLVAKCAEIAGADAIAVYNSGRYRLSGWPSTAGMLPIGNANDTMLELGERDILLAVRDAPVIAGVFAADPTHDMRRLLRKVREIGFSGVINFPTMGRIQGPWREDLESMGFGFDLELRMFEEAMRLDLFTVAYVFTENEAKLLAETGVDCIVPHMGLTAGGLTGSVRAVDMDTAIQKVQAMLDAATAVKPDILQLCHGGPIAEPADLAYVLSRTTAVGFVGASSIERLPIETALKEQVARFKGVRLP